MTISGGRCKLSCALYSSCNFLGGHDVVDYPLLIVPKRQGVFTGAVAFVAQAMSRPHRLVHSNIIDKSVV